MKVSLKENVPSKHPFQINMHVPISRKRLSGAFQKLLRNVYMAENVSHMRKQRRGELQIENKIDLRHFRK